MCGRIKTPEDLNQIKVEMQIEDLLLDYVPRYNIPPTAPVPVVTSSDGERRLSLMRWGLIAAWAKDAKLDYATFNARADSVAIKPAFRSAWKAGRRCLVIADGWFEWRKSDKQPYFIMLGNRQPMTFAGLWQEWQPPVGQPLRSCTIITTEAYELVGEVHDRMPVIIGTENWAAWLGEEPCDPAALLKPFPPERMTLWPVSKRVGSVKNNDPALTDRVFVGSS